jgi:hypothetical protein
VRATELIRCASAEARASRSLSSGFERLPVSFSSIEDENEDEDEDEDDGN